MINTTVVMLIVEDNPADVFFFKEAIEATGPPVRQHVVDNGSDALEFLRQHGDFADAERPDVVVLDLDIPLKKGREVLEAMAADPSLRLLPVAILSTSQSESHLVQLYPPGRCQYMVKTGDFRRLTDIAAQIHALATACKVFEPSSL